MRKRLKILVIDDDPIALEVVRERLTSVGHHVITRSEALGTTQAVRTENPDIVVLDVMMPALNGERIATLLKSGRSTTGVGIILHSSKTEAELVPIISETGAIGAITKTGDDQLFLDMFAKLVQMHNLPKSEGASG